MTDDQPAATGHSGQYLPSPVPADEHLLDGDLPFTAFGQFGPGRLDLRVFDQDAYWVDMWGEPHLLDDMTDEYRRNVIAHCETNAVSFHAGYAIKEAIEAVDATLNGTANAALLQLDLGTPIVADLDPTTWLNATPLIRRLRTLTESPQ
jgi:hypothetical protein